MDRGPMTSIANLGIPFQVDPSCFVASLGETGKRAGTKEKSSVSTVLPRGFWMTMSNLKIFYLIEKYESK